MLLILLRYSIIKPCLFYIFTFITNNSIMAKANAGTRKLNKIDIHNLSQRDRDILSMDTKEAMKKYKLEKQGVYDRRFALNKKLREAGLSVESVLGDNAPAAPEEVPTEEPKKARVKKAKQPKVAEEKQEEPKAEEPGQEPARDIVPYEKPLPVIMKPIEINFETFSLKLNGVPKRISVNPETNAIEIDL